ncbi:hypothetical protein V2A60_006249 [Cordyceps javanica]
MSYFYSYKSSNAQQDDDYRHSTKIRVETPGLSFSSSYNILPPRPLEPRYSRYIQDDEHYYKYQDSYCYGGAGPSYPAYSSNWERSRAAWLRPYSQRIRIRSGICRDESLSRHPHRGSDMYRYSGRDPPSVRPPTTNTTTTTHRTTHRTTITITTM